MSKLCIDVTGLNRHFGTRHVVKDFSLQIGWGEIHGFLGPNGSGSVLSTVALRIKAEFSAAGLPSSLILLYYTSSK